MNTITQQITISASPELIWSLVGNLASNPQWMVDYATITFLTSMHEGAGTRWRYSAPDGSEFVVEATAWYNGLGYEYTYVDGPPFRFNRGVIRLQEVPEGTIVQWTFSYEMGGMLGGMRASGIGKQLDLIITESLRKLLKQVSQAARGRAFEAKSAMRDAPDVEARSQYKPRHPSAMAERRPENAATPTPMLNFDFEATFGNLAEPPVQEGDAEVLALAEPPVVDDDTRPRPAVVESPYAPPSTAPHTESREFAIPNEPDGEPDFLQDFVAPTSKPAYTFDFDAPPAASAPATNVQSDLDALWAELDSRQLARVPADAEPRIVTPSITPLETSRPVDDTSAPHEMNTLTAEEYTAPTNDVPAPAEPPKISTLELPRTPEAFSSIWDVFGVPRPSDSEVLRALTDDERASQPVPQAPHEPVIQPGMRAVQRRKQAQVRRR